MLSPTPSTFNPIPIWTTPHFYKKILILHSMILQKCEILNILFPYKDEDFNRFSNLH